MSRLSKINDLAFDLVHEYMEPSKQFSYGKQIYDLSDEPKLSENQQKYLKLLKCAYEKFGNVHDAIFFSLVDYEKRWGLPAREFFQVLYTLKVWVLEQEEL
ncbi:hypothetical protein ACMDXZ_002199 [Enterococcus faecalis]